ncbi:MAG: hypothetical protein M3Q71_18660 [Chloroflexota bacterium]|nr:hypothetical protein [Chloroflexota bacterium]
MNTAVTRRIVTQKAEDLLRLADQGERKGIQILLTEDGAHFATSASDKTRLHRVSPDGCDCRGFQAWHRCMHYSLLLSQLGLIPDPTPAVEVVVLDEQPAACRSCKGEGFVRAFFGGKLSDWVAIPCQCREVAPAA